MRIICGFGERQLMLNIKEKNQIGNRFGKLELVDKEMFFISFNTRDT